MKPSSEPTFGLDSGSEPWIARLPGLGSVTVDEHGRVSVTAEPSDDEPIERRERALALGWGEPLSFARRGYFHTIGAGLAPPNSQQCFIFTGDMQDVSRLLWVFAKRNWLLLADRLTPLTIVDGVVWAHPRTAPPLMREKDAKRSGLPYLPARTDTDAMAVEWQRPSESCRVRGLVNVRALHPGQDQITALTGHDRFQMSASLLMGGALWPTQVMPEAATMSDRVHLDLAIASLPSIRLRTNRSDIESDVSAIEAWWAEVAT